MSNMLTEEDRLTVVRKALGVFNKLAGELTAASVSYYTGQPTLTDEQYDNKKRAMASLQISFRDDPTTFGESK